MDDDAIELDRRAINSDLNPLESAAFLPHIDPVVIRPSIHLGLTQENPASRDLRPRVVVPLSADNGASPQNQQQPQNQSYLHRSKHTSSLKRDGLKQFRSSLLI